MTEQTPTDESKPKIRRDTRPRDPEQWVHRMMKKYRAEKHQLAYRPDDVFFELADVVVPPERTLLGYDRLYTFWQAVRNLVDVPGSVAEIGTFRGGSAYFIASAFIAVGGSEVPFHVFDTFEGHPEAALSEHDPHHSAGRFNRTSFEDVSFYLSQFKEVRIHKGDALETVPQLAEDRYRLVHIDTDLFRPTLSCLEYFGERMSPGGVIVLDDYASPKCPGVPEAFLAYMQQPRPFQIWDLRTEQLMLVRR